MLRKNFLKHCRIEWYAKCRHRNNCLRVTILYSHYSVTMHQMKFAQVFFFSNFVQYIESIHVSNRNLILIPIQSADRSFRIWVSGWKQPEYFWVFVSLVLILIEFLLTFFPQYEIDRKCLFSIRCFFCTLTASTDRP